MISASICRKDGMGAFLAGGGAGVVAGAGVVVVAPADVVVGDGVVVTGAAVVVVAGGLIVICSVFDVPSMAPARTPNGAVLAAGETSNEPDGMPPTFCVLAAFSLTVTL